MLISAERLEPFIEQIFRHAGSSEQEARQVASNLVMGNLSGHDSHGVGQVPLYIRGVAKGTVMPNTAVEVSLDTGWIVVVNARRGYGQVAAQSAMELAIPRAKERGMCVAVLSDSFHVGRVGAWGELAAEAGLVGMFWVNATGHRPYVAPFGGTDPRFSTNPYCTAIPASDGHPAMIVDFATSHVANGKVRVAYNAGKAMGPETLIDHRGVETRDPKVIFEAPFGSMLTTGLHKGYGLSLVVEMLAGALAGEGCFSPHKMVEDKITNNMLAILIDPAVFGDPDAFRTEISRFQDWVKASPPAPGVAAVLVPGDPERMRRAERGAAGIPIDDETWRQIVAAARQVGVPDAGIPAAAA